MSSQATSDFRRRRKENLIKVCGEQCALCGYNRIPAGLEFHHIDPAHKKYGIASQGTCHNLEADLTEVKKCILVCANCHREIHNNFYSVEDLWDKQIFNEDYAQYLRDEKFQRTSTKEHFCKNCGIKISSDSKSGLCSPCFRKTTRLVERPSREELKFLIRTIPFTEIGRKYGVSDNAIRKWCQSENLPSKTKEIKSYSDEEWQKI